MTALQQSVVSPFAVIYSLQCCPEHGLASLVRDSRAETPFTAANFASFCWLPFRKTNCGSLFTQESNSLHCQSTTVGFRSILILLSAQRAPLQFGSRKVRFLTPAHTGRVAAQHSVKNGKFSIICTVLCCCTRCEHPPWQPLFPFSVLRHTNVTLRLRALCGRGITSFRWFATTHGRYSFEFSTYAARAQPGAFTPLKISFDGLSELPVAAHMESLQTVHYKARESSGAVLKTSHVNSCHQREWNINRPSTLPAPKARVIHYTGW